MNLVQAYRAAVRLLPPLRSAGPEKPAGQDKIGPVRGLYAATAALCVILALTAGVVIVGLHERALRDTAQDLRILARATAAETDRGFQLVDLALSGMAELAARADLPAIEAAMGTYDVHTKLFEKISSLPQLEALTIVNAEGKLINFSRYWPLPDVDLSDRDYFAALKSQPAMKSFISGPFRASGADSWSIHLARRMNGPRGEFAGLLLATVALGHFEDSYRQILDSAAMAISLVRDDNVLLARHPTVDTIGQTFPELGKQTLQGSFVLERSPVDQKSRINVALALLRYPLIIRATTTEDAALGDWRRESAVLAAGAMALILALGVAAQALAGHWTQAASLVRARAEQAEAEAELRRQQDRIATLDTLQAAKDEAERLQAAAEAANRAKSSFLAMISHELRTPLNAVIGFSELMKMEACGSLGNEVYKEYTGYIFDSGKHLLEIINDILDVSKAEAGKFELKSEPVDLAPLVRDVARIMQVKAAESRLTLVEIATVGDTTLRADPQKVRQILLNLLSNAIKFTLPGGEILVTISGGPEGVTIRLRDTGIGIAAADMERALTPFAQVDSSLSRQHAGTGLGLPLARTMAELHGGSLHLESEVGRGTTVTVFLPRKLSARLSPPAEMEHHRLEAAA